MPVRSPASSPFFLALLLAGLVLPVAGCGVAGEFVGSVAGGGADLRLARRAGGTGEVRAQAVASFADGSFVVTGYFVGTAVFGPGEPGETVLTSAGSNDAYVARYHPDLTLAWARRAGGPDMGIGSAVAANESDGSVIVAGTFSGHLVLAPGEPGEAHFYSLGANDPDAFVARYEADGSVSWGATILDGGDQYAYGVGTFPDGSSVVTGTLNGATIFGINEVNQVNLPAGGFGITDAYVARYNADGTLAWAKIAGGSTGDEARAVATFADGSSVVTGSFTGSAVFGFFEPNGTVLTSVGGREVFVARYQPDGMLEWAKQASGVGHQGGQGIVTYANGSSAVTGRITNQTTFGPGEAGQTALTAAGGEDLFVARYAANGALLWARRAGGADYTAGNAIARHVDGSLLVGGVTRGLATFGLGESGETTLTAAGNYDAFTARFDPGGGLLWARRAGGPGIDGVGGVAVLPAGHGVSVGWFANTATFGPGEPNEIQLPSAGARDAFVARHGPTGDLE